MVRVLPDHDAALAHLLRQLGREVVTQSGRHSSLGPLGDGGPLVLAFSKLVPGLLGIRPRREQISERRSAENDAVVEIRLPAESRDPLGLGPKPAQLFGQLLLEVEFLGDLPGRAASAALLLLALKPSDRLSPLVARVEQPRSRPRRASLELSVGA